MTKVLFGVAAAAVALLLTVPVQAAKIKTWTQHTAAHYEKARFDNVVVSNEGALRLSREVKPLASLEATHVWDVIEDGQGNLLVATGPDGKLYKVTADGKVSTAFASEDSQILCLARAPDGGFIAGTGPGGQILKIDAKGEPKVLCQTPESYVWALAVESKTGTIFAGTGPKGRIYRVTPDGKAAVLYAAKQEHILSLGLDPVGTVYAGTDKGGVIYRIDAKGKGSVLYSTGQGEVRTLLVTTDGIYAGTSAPTRTRIAAAAAAASSGGTSSGSSGGSGTTVAAGSIEAAPVNTGSSGSSDSREPAKGTAGPAPSAPTSGENSLYRISLDGTVREIFRDKTMILSQLRHNGRLLVGTGMLAQLFEIDEQTRERSEIARLDHGQILCLCKRQDGSIVLGASDPAKLYVLNDRFAAKGTVTSEVLDAKLQSKWGALRWRAETPAGTAVTVAVRSGNTSEPDDTWSDWSTEQTDAAQAIVAAPTARYLQYRVTLTTTSDKATPVVHSLALRYQTTNQAPEITSIEVPDLEAANLDNPKKLKLKWSVTDANEDEVTSDLYIRKDGWKQWVLLEEGLEKREFEWDTTTTPSGTYQLKIIASDRRDNSEEESLTAERTSAPLTVSHDAPTVTLKLAGMDGDRAIFEATASDPAVRLTSASFSVDGKKWVSVFPVDGLFDSKTEKFRFKTEGLKTGSHVLVLRVKDAAANTGSGDAVFSVPGK